MSDLQAYYDNYATQPSRWAHPDPARCGCHGGGWFLSELDTFHACPEHSISVKGRKPPHPEDEFDSGFDYDLFRYLCQRDAYRYYRDATLRDAESMGEEMDVYRFRTLAQAELPGGFSGDHSEVTPADWVKAARAVHDVYAEDADRIAREEADKRAQANGYSCALEARWAMDAMYDHF